MRKVTGPSFESCGGKVGRRPPSDAGGDLRPTVWKARHVRPSLGIPARLYTLSQPVCVAGGGGTHFVSVRESDTHCCQPGNEVLSVSLSWAPLASRLKLRN